MIHILIHQNQALLQPQGELHPSQPIFKHCSWDHLLKFYIHVFLWDNSQWVPMPKGISAHSIVISALVLGGFKLATPPHPPPPTPKKKKKHHIDGAYRLIAIYQNFMRLTPKGCYTLWLIKLKSNNCFDLNLHKLVLISRLFVIRK